MFLLPTVDFLRDARNVFKAKKITAETMGKAIDH